jgi:hypothetical protein
MGSRVSFTGDSRIIEQHVDFIVVRYSASTL